MERSDDCATASVSVPELLLPVGSVTPFGATTVAVLLIVPVASERTVAVKVNVAVPLAARLTVALMFPLPFGLPQLDPADAVQVQLAFINCGGRLSVTVAPIIELGPLFLAIIV